ncbi:MAG: hypothetical protein F4130_07935 [Acidobacteria bacterium]|nr:hypothetical protein [Acidobacteriota bacterium]MYH22191.1 hypothetical protein [Acidobacteriota bacterium]
MSHVLSGEGTKASRLNLPAGFYVVEMAVQNEEEDNFIVEIEPVEELGCETLANKIVGSWKGSVTLRVGPDAHPEGRQVLSVDSSGTWEVKFLRE